MSTLSSSPQHRPSVVVGMTGASGALYAVRLVEVLLAAGCQVQLSISTAGAAVLQQEMGLHVDLQCFRPEALLPAEGMWKQFAHLAAGRDDRRHAPPAADVRAGWGRLHYHHHSDLMAPMASGSARSAGMVICPCSGGTLSAVAHAASGNLIQRAAEVHLKERRKLILVPREAPLSLVHIDNMRRATEAGAVVLPASPGFYHGVRNVADLVDFVVARICDQLAVEHQLMPRWGEASEESAGP